MEIRPSILAICTVSAVLVGTALTFMVNKNESVEPVVEVPDSLQPARKNKSLTVLPDDFDWSKAQEEELLAIFESLESQHSTGNQLGFELETTVEPGEQIVADSFEGENGEFVFTTLVPTIETWPDGRAGVKIQVDSVSVTLNGESRKVFRENDPDRTYEIEIPPNGMTSRLASSDYGRYILHLAPRILKGDRIRVVAKAEYDQTATGTAELRKN